MEADKTIIEMQNENPSRHQPNGKGEKKNEKREKRISKGAVAGIGVGAAAVGAVGAAIPFVAYGKDPQGHSEVSTSLSTEQEGKDELLSQQNTSEVTDQEGKESAMFSESNDVNVHVSELPVATSVTDDMTPAEAFAAARAEVGPGGIYYYHGQAQGTYYESEWNSMSEDEKHNYWASVHHTQEQQQTTQYYEEEEIDVSDNTSGVYFGDYNGNDIPDVVVDLDANGIGDLLLVDVTIENGEIVSVEEIQAGEFLIEPADVEDVDDINGGINDGYTDLTDEDPLDVEDHGDLGYNDYDYTANTDLDPYINIDNNMDVSDMA